MQHLFVGGLLHGEVHMVWSMFVEHLYNTLIRHGWNVAKVMVIPGDLSQDTTHNLARSCLG